MKKLIDVFKITMTNLDAKINFFICLACCIGAYVVVWLIPSGTTVFNIVIIGISILSITSIQRYSQYFSAVLNKYNEIEKSKRK